VSRPIWIFYWANALQGLFTDDDRNNGQYEEEHRQANGDIEKGFFNSTTGCKNSPAIPTGQATQSNTFVL